MSSYFSIGLSALSVAGGAAVLLSQGGRLLAGGWALTCLSLSALALLQPGPPWLLALLVAGLVGLAVALAGLSSETLPSFLNGNVRKTLAVLAVWGVSLLILRSTHASHAHSESHAYWFLYATAALFGLGLLTLILKRDAVHVWSGVGLLLLSPLPTSLTAAADVQSGDGWLLSLLCASLCAVHGILATVTLSRVRRMEGSLDVKTWEEFQG